MKKIVLLVSLAFLIPLTLWAIPQEDMVWKSVSHSSNKAKIKKGIEAAIDDMNFITRPIARSRLKDSNLAFRKITIKHQGSNIYVQHDNRKAIVSPANGSKIKWTREDGEVFTVTQKVSANKITQVFYAEDGKKLLVYKFNDDFSKMWVSIRVDSPKLPAPMRYTMVYKR